MTEISELKQTYRKYLTVQRKQLSLAQRETYSKQIIHHLRQYLTPFVTTSEKLQLLTYCSLPVEVDTSALFEDERFDVFVPRMLPEQHLEWVEVNEKTVWKHIDFGVQEPEHGQRWQKSNLKTALIAPLLGFDRSGNRLGMGKGFFDRWLSLHAQELDDQVGLAFSCQELPKVPMEQHDAPLSTIITEHGVLACPIK